MVEEVYGFTRTFLVGKVAGEGDVWVEVQYREGRLSLTGVIGPMANGNCRGNAGQINLREHEIVPTEGWTAEKINLLADTWDRWHLNDCRAGSPRQMEYLRTSTAKCPGYPVSHYEWASDLLTRAGLNPDHEHMHNGAPYRYGSAWLTEEVPGQVLANLVDENVFPLPTSKRHPWLVGDA